MTEKIVDDALAVAKHVEGMLPPLNEIVGVPAAPGDLGPAVLVPAVYLRIITAAFEGEVLSRRREAMEAKIARAEMKPKSEINDETITAIAVYLAGEAHDRTFDPAEAAMCLWKAAATIAVARMPAFSVLEGLDSIHAMTRADVAETIGRGATRQ